MGRLTRTIAIDFDGCLCENAWPKIGEPHWDVIHAAIREHVMGSSLILWTCRVGHLLSEAIEACENWGLTFDAVNENLPERLEYYGTESRKISADEYWDDHAVHMPEPPNIPLTLEDLREMDGEPVYCIDGNGTHCWCLVNCDDALPYCLDNETGLWEGCFYGMTGDGKNGLHMLGWLAYRRKKEDGTT